MRNIARRKGSRQRIVNIIRHTKPSCLFKLVQFTKPLPVHPFFSFRSLGKALLLLVVAEHSLRPLPFPLLRCSSNSSQGGMLLLVSQHSSYNRVRSFGWKRGNRPSPSLHPVHQGLLGRAKGLLRSSNHSHSSGAAPLLHNSWAAPHQHLHCPIRTSTRSLPGSSSTLGYMNLYRVVPSKLTLPVFNRCSWFRSRSSLVLWY